MAKQDDLGKKARKTDFLSRTMPLPIELQQRCPGLSLEHDRYCYLRGGNCECSNFRECKDYVEIIRPAIDRRKYRV